MRGLRRRGLPAGRRGYPDHVFFFFSNRLGCLGSLLVSAVLTLVVLALLSRL